MKALGILTWIVVSSLISALIQSWMMQCLWRWFLAHEYGHGPSMGAWFGIATIVGFVVRRNASSTTKTEDQPLDEFIWSGIKDTTGTGTSQIRRGHRQACRAPDRRLVRSPPQPRPRGCSTACRHHGAPRAGLAPDGPCGYHRSGCSIRRVGARTGGRRVQEHGQAFDRRQAGRRIV